MTPFLTTLTLPVHGTSPSCTTATCGRSGGLVGLKSPPNVWSTFGTKPTICGADAAVRVLDQLQRVLVLDRLAAGVELQDAAVGHLVAGPERLRHPCLQGCPDLALRVREALNERPRRVEVVVDEPVGVVAAVEARVPPGDDLLVGLRLRRLQARAGAEAADVACRRPSARRPCRLRGTRRTGCRCASSGRASRTPARTPSGWLPCPCRRRPRTCRRPDRGEAAARRRSE